MFEHGYIFHYITILIITAVPALFAALGQSRSTQAAFKAIRIQPAAEKEIANLLIIGNALIETGAIIGLIFGCIMIAKLPQGEHLFWINISELGIACALGMSGAVVGYMSSYPVEAGCLAIARQPFFSKKIQIFCIVMQSIMQSPIILAFVVTIFIKTNIYLVHSLNDTLQLIAAGLAIGLGSIGPTIGLGLFLEKASSSLGINRLSYNKIIAFSFMTEAIIEASVVFSLLIALFILKSSHTSDEFFYGIRYIAAALCIGLGTIGVGIALGKTASRACHHIGINPDLYGKISSTSLISQALIEAQTIYAFIIAIRLIS